MIKELVTTEHFRKKFKNNFDLCNFSIDIGRTMIMSGSPTTLGAILREIDIRSDELHTEK
jgi:hypothetical protein